ncbi:MAG: hypothetical protein IJD86_09340 [Clostridia bacterium]|nr:hypothetical protein [Clostridia bacterium]
MRYEGNKTQAISFPIGGIGTGSIGLSGSGRLIDWEIRNRPDKCSNNGFSFFAVKAEKDGQMLDARVLNGDLTAPFHGTPNVTGFSGYGYGPDRSTLAGVPHFSKCVFDGSYPYAKISFKEEKFPGKPSLSAFNPFIPMNDFDSGIPAAFFTVEIENDTNDDITYTVAASLQNLFNGGRNESFSKDGFSGVMLSPVNIDKESPKYGNLCLITDDEGCSLQEYWFRGSWFDSLGVFWQDFLKEGAIRKRTYENEIMNQKDVCTLTKSVFVPANEKRSVRFIISWSFPNFENYWNPVSGEENGLANVWKNYYAHCFRDAKDAGLYALKNWERLDRETRLFHDALAASTLPDFALDAVMSTMSVLKTATCIRLPDGSFYGWEGLQGNHGSCEGTCTHVWNYAYALPFLFPKLERNLRTTNYLYNQDENGGLHFRTQIPLGRAYSAFRPCADGQFGDIMKTYREWKISGDNDWLLSVWPMTKKAMEYAWSDKNPDRWDIDMDGVLEGRQHHTLDMELFGPSSWLNGFYLGALKAAKEMAEAMNDLEDAEKYEALFESGRKWADIHLFNGEYYIQKVQLDDYDMLSSYGEDAVGSYWNEEAGEIKYQIQNGCSIDQVTAQWHANLMGLKDIFDKEHVKKALESIYKYNFISMRDHFNPCRLYSLNDERGTVMCQWPKGVRKPVIPIPYAEETMYGFEYQAAVNMLQNGMIDQGFELIASIRARHDGENRNPYNEMECGSNYARSMAAYSILLASSGFTYDMTKNHIGFAPIYKKGEFKSFWSAGEAWGMYEEEGNTGKVSVLYGKIDLDTFYAGGNRVKCAYKNDSLIETKMDGENVRFVSGIRLSAGDAVCMEIDA